MTTTDVETRTHPVVRFVDRVHAVLDDLRETPAWSMTPDEQHAALVDPTRAEAWMAALRLRVLAAADTADVAAASAATSTSAWLAQATRRTRSTAHADVLLSRSLEDAHIATRDAPGGRAARRGPGPRGGPGGRRPAGVRRRRRPGPRREAPPVPRGAARRRRPQ